MQSECTLEHTQWLATLSIGSPYLMQYVAEQRRPDLRWLRTLLVDVEVGPVRDNPTPAHLAAMERTSD